MNWIKRIQSFFHQTCLISQISNSSTKKRKLNWEQQSSNAWKGNFRYQLECSMCLNCGPPRNRVKLTKLSLMQKTWRRLILRLKLKNGLMKRQLSLKLNSRALRKRYLRKMLKTYLCMLHKGSKSTSDLKLRLVEQLKRKRKNPLLNRIRLIRRTSWRTTKQRKSPISKKWKRSLTYLSSSH